MSTNTQEYTEVFLVAYTYFNFDLQIFVEIWTNRHSPLLKTPLRK
jgi:hypothetical protein